MDPLQLSIGYVLNLIRYVQYKPTSLEKSFKSELLTEVDLGIPIELIDSRAYRLNPNGQSIFIYKNE